MSSSNSRKPTALQSILAGGAAGGVESFVTYPTEYVKTRQQLSKSVGRGASPLAILLDTLKKHGLQQLYSGSGVFCLSNASKSAVRFATFDTVKNSFSGASSTSRTSAALQTMFAGVCAGVAESVTVLTPGENIKTKLIDGGSKNAGTVYTSSTQALSAVLRESGVRGLYRGVVPVAMKQSANAVVRFTSYGYFLAATRQVLSNNKSINVIAPALAGGMAGVVTVYATMPFDNVKTKMQSIQGGRAYSGSFDCARQIFSNEGLKGLWKGTVPRLMRLSVSGIVSFSIYEQVIALTRDFRTDFRVSGTQKMI